MSDDVSRFAAEQYSAIKESLNDDRTPEGTLLEAVESLADGSPGDATGQDPRSKESNLSGALWSGLASLGESVRQTSVADNPVADDSRGARSERIVACCMEPLGSSCEAAVASDFGEAVREFGRSSGIPRLEDPLIAAGVGSVLAQFAKVAYKLGVGEVSDIEAEAYLAKAMVGIVSQVLRGAGYAAGVALGAAIGQPAVGAFLAKLLAESLPKLAPAVSAGAAKVLVFVIEMTLRLADSVRQFLLNAPIVGGLLA